MSPIFRRRKEEPPAKPMVAGIKIIDLLEEEERRAGTAEGPGAPEAIVTAEASPVESAPEPAAEEPGEEPAPEISPTKAALIRLAECPEAILSWIAEDGYPMNVAVPIEVRPDEGVVRFAEPADFRVAAGTSLAITGSHVRVLPEGGFDERRSVTVWGKATARPRGRFIVSPSRVWVRDDTEQPLPALYERDLPKARAYYEAMTAEYGYVVRPKISNALLFFRATRAPFLSATIVPVVLGIAIAARGGFFDPLTAIITFLAAAFVHFGLNVVNDVFDTIAGADDANKTPTMFSGGSRVIQNVLMSVREMSGLAIGCYAVAGVLGFLLLVLRGSPALVAIAAIGVFISLAYTMPPFKLVYRGLGEIATAIGFGPVMLLGAYVVQSRGSIAIDPILASLPVGLLVAMILYVNEIPDRAGDAAAGKLTLPVRWTKERTIRAWDLSVGAAFGISLLGFATGLLPIFTPIVLLALPLWPRIRRGLVEFYDNPYALMPFMAANIRLHLVVGVLLLVAYLLAGADRAFAGLHPYLWWPRP